MTAALIDLADVLVADFDPVEFLYRVTEHCMNLLDISDAGVMLAPAGAPLQLVAASSERMREVELFELDARTGPCLTAYHEGTAIDHTPLDASPVRWPEFSAHAFWAGYRCVHATPIRLREDTIGVLNLFRRTPEVLGEADRHLSKALADTTAISLVQQASLDHHRTVNRQLQRALDSRSAIEQAKGFLASHNGTDPGTAFEQLRAHARRHRIRLVDLARDVVAGAVTLPPPDSTGEQPGKSGPKKQDPRNNGP
ncbi:GAF and ANTAR domain-containing protein [Streptomyces minutiscleroticus]|uniref:GAF and ANTAR domain-containing protein n=1 Tax=Streptomyces minutiscleroticus TaxID=68238 RepID=UPI003327EE53